MPAANDTLQLKKAEAQERALAHYRMGATKADACRKVHRDPATWRKWMTETGFAAQVAQIDALRADPDGPVVDFVSFRRAMFGMDTYWHQLEIIAAVEEAKNQEITLVLLPPEWGKSTVLEDHCCYVLGPVDPDFCFCIISESRTQSRKMVGRIQRRMTDEDGAYFQTYGPFRSDDRGEQKPWNADYFTVAKAGIDQRDYSIEARGAGSKLYGSRYGKVLCDDIQSRQTLNQTDNLLEFIRGDLITRPGTEGGMVFVGTRIGPGDVYERMLEVEDMIDKVVCIPALDEEGRSNFPAVYDAEGNRKRGPDGKPIGWSVEELERRRSKVGEEVWARVYMQQPISKVGAPFSEDRIRRALSHELVMGDVNRGVGTMATIDPALSGYASIKVFRYDSSNLWLIDTANIPAPGRYEELFALVEHYSQLWHPGEWVFEVGSMQAGLARDDRVHEMAQRLGFRVIEHTTRTNKHDSKIGIAAMADGFGRGEVHIPYGDEASQRQCTQLIKELRMWRPDIPTKQLRQDEVTSFWFGWHRWQQIRKTLESNREFTIGGLPWRPTSLAGVGAA